MIEMITARTGFISGAVNAGIFIERDHECTVIDTGLDDRAGKTIYKALQKCNLRVDKIIITHAHADHTGGAAWLQNQTGAELYASNWEGSFLKNPGLEPFYLYSSKPVAELETKFFLAKPCSSFVPVSPGDYLNDLEILDISGHSPGQIGIRTPDNVLFVADAFFSEAVLEKYYIPYFADIGKSIETLNRMIHWEADVYLPAHGTLSTDIRSVIQLNLNRINHIQEEIIEYIRRENLTREGIISRFVKEREIQLNTGQYYLISATISAFLAFLCEQERISQVFSEGFPKWTLTEQGE